jgi:deazaflavin-dependent oxidoreductase (nitroreductase family)
MDMKATNAQVIADFRSGGPISVEGMHRERLILLTTTDPDSGRSRTAPMLFLHDETGILVIASNNGAHVAPHWFDNILADPLVHVEEPDREYDGVARVLSADDRDVVWQRIIVDNPFLVDQQERAGRPLPWIEILPTAI